MAYPFPDNVTEMSTADKAGWFRTNWHQHDYIRGYWDSLLWLGLDCQLPDDESEPESEPVDFRGEVKPSDLEDSILAEIVDDLSGFVARLEEEGLYLDACYSEELGHDFNLTRNGHGAGFWDGDWDHLDQLSPGWSRKVSAISKEFGSASLERFGAEFSIMN